MALIFIPDDLLEKLRNGDISFTEFEEFVLSPGAKATETPDYSGIVYLLKSGSFYKIGRTKDLKRRLREYRQKTKVGVVLKVKTTNAPALEAKLLSLVSSKRIGNTEWLELTQSEVSLLKNTMYSYDA